MRSVHSKEKEVPINLAMRGSEGLINDVNEKEGT